MPFPGFPLSTTRSNATPMPNTHPADHNAVNAAANDLQAQVDALTAQIAALQDSTFDTGDIKKTILAAAPSGWLMLDGTLISNAVALFPDLWAVAPAVWKIGNDLQLPNMSNRVAMGGGTLGASGGSNSHTLGAANLPAHVHTIDHDHPSANTGTESADHSHTINHDHGNYVTGAGEGAHEHLISITTDAAITGAGSRIQTFTAAGSHVTTGSGGSNVSTHQHNVNLPLFSGSSGGTSATHFHSVNLPSFSGSSGSVGSGTPVDHTPANLRVNFMIKT